MMAGNPSWWSMHPPSHQQSSALLSTSQSLFPSPYVLGSSLPLNSLPDNQEHQQSWSQLLLGGGLSGDEDRFSASHFQPKKFENWDEQIINLSPRVPVVDHVKQEVSQSNNLYIPGSREFQAASWPQIIPVNSPRSCVTTSTLTTSILDFAHIEADRNNQQNPDHSYECNSTAPGGGACKKARVQPSSSGQPPLKVRKEKLGDRITALHQLVSPFGKTDTASVLLEAIGYIRFLQGQIEALSSPYLNISSANMRNQQCVQGDHINGTFPEDPGQLLNDTCRLKRKGAPNNQDDQDKPKDLRSRGLCLVPVSCTLHVESENGADYWAPALGGGGF